MPVTSEQILRLTLRERIRLIAYISTIVQDRHVAEDLFQDLSVDALNKADTINDEQHLQGWLRTAARFRAIDHLRQQSRRPKTFSEDLIAKLDEAWAAADPEPASDALEALRECLGEMSPRARRLIELHYVDGLKGHAIAVKLERTTNAVYVAMSRVHQVLRDCVRHRLRGEGMRGRP